MSNSHVRRGPGKIFTVKQTDATKSGNQVCTTLFERWEIEENSQLTNYNETQSLQASLKNMHSRLKDVHEVPFETPPMRKKVALPPMAPVKQRKHLNRDDLKPKRLIYFDEEMELTVHGNDGTIASSTRSRKVSLSSREETVKEQQIGKSDVQKCDTKEKMLGLHARHSVLPTRTPLNAVGQHNTENNESSISGNRERTKVLQKAKENRVTKGFRTNMHKGIEKENPSSSTVNDTRCKGFNPYSIELSQYTGNLSWTDKLYWLQPRRDVGMWIQCCRIQCQKWRYVEEHHDPVDVPKLWFCEMNQDRTVASCDIPEISISPAIQLDLIENQYNAGSIVWARCHGYPWWPAIVDDSMDTLSYYKLNRNGNIPEKYHVTYFNEELLETSWVCQGNIKPFAHTEKSRLIKKTVYHGIDYKSRLDRAYELACNALSLSIMKRLQKFSCVAHYNNSNASPSISNSSNNNINNSKITNHINNINTLLLDNEQLRHKEVILSDEIASSQPQLDEQINDILHASYIEPGIIARSHTKNINIGQNDSGVMTMSYTMDTTIDDFLQSNH